MKTRWVASGVGVICVAGASVFAGTTSARAEVIGVAAVVRNDVAEVLTSQVIPIAVGQNVTRDEVVRTGSASAAKLVFSDNTNLSMSAGSTVTLNKFVYSGPASYEKAAFQLAKGAFRFTTGSSDKRAYEIKTPTATIGVRGTVLDILVNPDMTTVRLQHGAFEICSVNSNGETNRASCKQFSQACQTATATSTSVAAIAGGGSVQGKCVGGWSFSNLEKDQALLESTDYADATSPGPPNAAGGNGGNGVGGGGSLLPQPGPLVSPN